MEELEPRVLLNRDLPLLSRPLHLPERPAAVASRLTTKRDAAVLEAALKGQVMVTPGERGQKVRASFTMTNADADYRNEFGVFLVDDAQGRIGRFKPGSRGYAAAALARARRHKIFGPGEKLGTTRSLDLPCGRFFGYYLIQNT